METQSKENEQVSSIERVEGGLASVSPDIIREFNKALIAMDDFRAELAEAGDWNALAHGLVALQDFKKNLQAVMDAIEIDIHKNLPEKKVVVEGLGIIERRTATTRKWESDVLLNHIVREYLDNGTGEITPEMVMNLIDGLKKVLPFTPSLGWRTTALKEIGFDPDSYSDVSFGRKTVTIKR